MTAILDNLALGGPEVTLKNGRPCRSAIAFQLSRPPRHERRYVPYDEVEAVMSRLPVLVVRFANPRDEHELRTEGIENALRLLDLASVEAHDTMALVLPHERYVAATTLDNRVLVEHKDVTFLGMGVAASIMVTDAEGRLKPEPVTEPATWMSAYRYYRESQLATDVYAAYRSLWLAFENLLTLFVPKNSGEREKDWLARCGAWVRSTQSLKSQAAQFDRVIDTQYTQVRNHLFHGKGELVQAANASVDPRRVADAYRELAPHWRALAAETSNLSRGGGVITYEGFAHMMKLGLANQQVSFLAREIDENDTALDGEDFDSVEMQDHAGPGVARLVARYRSKGRVDIRVVVAHSEEKLSRVAPMLGGVLSLTSGDDLISTLSYRLRNNNSPRFDFD